MKEHQNNLGHCNTTKNSYNIPTAVFLLRKLWIVNYYIQSLSNKFSNESINTGVSREMIF